MSKNKNNNSIRSAMFLLVFLVSTVSSAWQGHGGWAEGPRYHPRQDHYRPHHPAYGQGGFYYGGGWNGPNVIINVPAPSYYPPECHSIEVCNRYGDCWLEEQCG